MKKYFVQIFLQRIGVCLIPFLLVFNVTNLQALPKCKYSNANDKTHCSGSWQTPSGLKYVGGLLKGKFHGKGILHLSNGSRFEGVFEGLKFRGTVSYSNGQKWHATLSHEGYYNWEPEGPVKIVYPDGSVYEGEVLGSDRHGFGTFRKVDGSTQTGQFKFSKFISSDEFPKAGSSPEITSPDESQTETPSSRSAEVVSASSGSGFAVTKDGYLITNNHVIDGCQLVFVHNKGNKIPAIVVTRDTQNDLALLKADFKPESVLPLTQAKPEILQDIYVAGYPFGYNISSSIKVTKGIISSLTGVGNNFSEIQIDAALQGGNSGGPIVDDKGNVVGVAVSKLDVKYALENFGAIPENTNFGIKASVVDNLLASNGIAPNKPNVTAISKSKLGRSISNGTYYISCWMTVAQIEAMRTKKVMFDQLQ